MAFLYLNNNSPALSNANNAKWFRANGNIVNFKQNEKQHDKHKIMHVYVYILIYWTMRRRSQCALILFLATHVKIISCIYNILTLTHS